MAEVHQKQMEALQSAHNQQFASVLSVIGKPWSRGGATGATPSTTTSVLSSTRSTDRYFSGELL
jgi:hypothetical protein